MTREHSLKTWPSEFAAIRDGRKLFEVRSNRDRDFAVDDVLVLRLWDPASPRAMGQGSYIGRGRPVLHIEEADAMRARVTYILHGGRFGLTEGVCVMSIRVLGQDEP
jgi:hypothetical protein